MSKHPDFEAFVAQHHDAVVRGLTLALADRGRAEDAAQDAFANGFEPVLVREATNSNRPHLADASLEDIDRYMGRVVGLAEGLEMLG